MKLLIVADFMMRICEKDSKSISKVTEKINASDTRIDILFFSRNFGDDLSDTISIKRFYVKS